MSAALTARRLQLAEARYRSLWFDTPESEEALVERLAWAESEGVEVAVVGLGSNLLVADEGFPGLVLKLAGDLA